MSIAPCLNCADRKVGCHGECEKYKTFKDKRDERNSTVFENKKEYFAHFAYHKKRGRK